MSGEINWTNLFPNPLDAEVAQGYRDGTRRDSPEPSANRHPAYIHGFKNGREDAGILPSGETAQERRARWAFIKATCG